MAFTAGPGLANATGSRAFRPPETYYENRPPTIYDTRPFQLMDLWLDKNTDFVYILVNLNGTSTSKGMLATWIQITSGGTVTSVGAGHDIFISGSATMPIVNVTNAITLGDLASIIGLPSLTLVTGDATITAGNINMTNTNTAGTIGIINWGGTRFIHNYGANNTFVGGSSGNTTLTATDQTGVGHNALSSVTTGGGQPNAAFGSGSMQANTTGGLNSAFGSLSLSTNVSSGANCAFGQNCMQGLVSGVGQNTGMGYHALNPGAGANTFQQCVALGYGALTDIVSGIATIGIGYFAGAGYIGAEHYNIVLGTSNGVAGETNVMRLGHDGTISAAIVTNTTRIWGSNLGIGSSSLPNLTSGTNNIALGTSSLRITSGSTNIAIGLNAGIGLTGAESNNVLIGFAGLTGTSGLIEIGIPGDTVPYVHNWGAGNSFFGRSGNLTLTPGTAVNNAGNGNTALAALTTGFANAAMGNASLQACTTGNSNAAMGATSLQACTTGSQNAACGGGALIRLTTGTQNTALGFQALDNVLTGTLNIGIGLGAGSSYTGAESGNIIIGSFTGTLGESFTLRVGHAGAPITSSYIQGIFGKTVDAGTGTAVFVDTNGLLGTVVSSARYKENINDMGSYSNVLLKLRPVTFNYKKHSPTIKSVGLIAEEVAVEAPNLVIYDKDGLPETVKYHDLVPMMLNEIIKLRSEIDALKLRGI